MQQSEVTALAESTPWEALPDTKTVERTAESLRANGFKVDVVADRKAAIGKIGSLIPDGARVMTASSATLDAIGLTKILSEENHPWVNLKGRIVSEQDPQKKAELRRQAIFADYFLGSVHAVTETGHLVAGSASGSQLAAYAYGGDNLILVVGAQKITANLDEALLRLREHSVPLEDARMKRLGARGTVLSKVLIYEREPWRNVHVVIINEKLGF
ncbi:MAG: lactate utilization protein [Nitrososphaerota archaeon]|nr:lactate utilization protein [Nitrososphaerota archaeon]